MNVTKEKVRMEEFCNACEEGEGAHTMGLNCVRERRRRWISIQLPIQFSIKKMIQILNKVEGVEEDLEFRWGLEEDLG